MDPKHHFGGSAVSDPNSDPDSSAVAHTNADSLPNSHAYASTNTSAHTNTHANPVAHTNADSLPNSYADASANTSACANGHSDAATNRCSANHQSGARINLALLEYEFYLGRGQDDQILFVCRHLSRRGGYLQLR